MSPSAPDVLYACQVAISVGVWYTTVKSRWLVKEKVMDWAFFLFAGVFMVICVWLSIQIFGGAPPPAGLTKEEEARDAICGEMWREMGE